LLALAMIVAGGATCGAAEPAVTEVPVGRYGIACKNAHLPRQSPVPSYRLRDIGKAGVPVLGTAQRRLARSIAHDVHSQTLRFAVFPGQPALPFIAFDATNGPCSGVYWVLNSRFGNMYYRPSESYTFAAPTPSFAGRPWMHEKGIIPGI